MPRNKNLSHAEAKEHVTEISSYKPKVMETFETTSLIMLFLVNHATTQNEQAARRNYAYQNNYGNFLTPTETKTSECT
jgi:hypothetical protein